MRRRCSRSAGPARPRVTPFSPASAAAAPSGKSRIRAAPRPVGETTRATAVAAIVNLVPTGMGPSDFDAACGLFILPVLSYSGGPLRTPLGGLLATGAAGLVLITFGTVAAEGGLAATLVMTLVAAFGLAHPLVLRGYVAAAKPGDHT